MDPKWMPALLTFLIAAAGWLVNYGTFQQKLNTTAEQGAKTQASLDKHKEEIWPVVRETERDVANIKGRLSAKGRGANA